MKPCLQGRPSLVALASGRWQLCAA